MFDNQTGKPGSLKSEAEFREEISSHRKPKLIAPSAKALVVDDNEFNLKVAKGFLHLSQIETDIAYSGKEAIELVKENDYDIIFMDYMMPEMDGIETTKRIRELGDKCKDLPVIALTANTVPGAKEMFLSNGFNDFAAKPINIPTFEKMLNTWLPDDKITFESDEAQATESDEILDEDELFIKAISEIKDIDVPLGLSRVEDDVYIYKATVGIFHKNLLSECNKMTALLDEKNIADFGTSVHSMKSMLSTIGAMDLSESALVLEHAAKKGEADYCYTKYPLLHQKLLALNERLVAVFLAADM